MTAFIYPEQWPDWAEDWARDERYGSVSGVLCQDDDDRHHEADRLVIGERVASGLAYENGGPDYRAWERADAIEDRARTGRRV